MVLSPTTNKQKFESGQRFKVPEYKDEVFQLVEDRYGKDYIAHLHQNRWCYYAAIDLVNDTHLFLHVAGSDPSVIAFDNITFMEK